MSIFHPHIEGATPKIVPSTAFLIILNGLLLFAALTLSGGLIGLIFGTPILLGFILVSAIPHTLFRTILEKNRILKPLPRVVIYTSPFWGLLILSLLLPSPPQKPNQQNPAISPSGKFQVTASSPAMGWLFKIETADKTQRWEIPTNFGPQFNVYWAWDAEDRLWTYNSDDGEIMFWTNEDNDWRSQPWRSGHSPSTESASKLQPPELLYPDYAKPDKS